MDAYENATRLKLDIKIKAPIIIVPVHSKSTEGVAMDLGSLHLFNSITALKVPNNEHKAIIDDIKIELNNMKVSKVSIVANSNVDDDISILSNRDSKLNFSKNEAFDSLCFFYFLSC